MQTLLDTNIQLYLYTRHAQGLPVHYGFLTIKQAAACLGSEKGVTGEGVGEWLCLSAVCTAVTITCRTSLMMHEAVFIM